MKGKKTARARRRARVIAMVEVVAKYDAMPFPDQELDASIKAIAAELGASWMETGIFLDDPVNERLHFFETSSDKAPELIRRLQELHGVSAHTR